MEMYQETPDIRWDRVFCMIGMGGAAVAMGWLAWRVISEPNQSHALEFVAAALLLGLFLYFGWLIWALSTVRYTLTPGRLLLRQAWSRVEMPLSPETHLYRWRHRWSWDGGVQRDLSVETVRLFPPFWLWQEDEIWVLASGQQAVAFRPSGHLLAQVKAQVRNTTGMAG
ncbi:MAG TPA: hypothetical protein VNT75_05350 [Symbiobacteriaceae bacterium]|nr:hypothetical protein [Symbiobacteriaceae bacterium]